MNLKQKADSLPLYLIFEHIPLSGQVTTSVKQWIVSSAYESECTEQRAVVFL